jgi:hypothetical protein
VDEYGNFAGEWVEGKEAWCLLVGVVMSKAMWAFSCQRQMGRMLEFFRRDLMSESLSLRDMISAVFQLREIFSLLCVQGRAGVG